MKEKLKLLKRIQNARERTRDAAAAEAAVAERERRERASLRSDIELMRREIMGEAAKRFNAASSIADVEKIGLDMCDADRCLLEAEESLGEAAELSREAALQLRGREKDLRLSEKLVSRVKGDISKSEAKEEQAMVDDMTASRRSCGT